MDKEEFSEQNYGHPRGDRLKYKGRTTEEGRYESNRRLEVLPLLERVSLELSKKYSIEPPNLVPKGSAVVGRSVKSSDLDIAVVVPPLPKFCSDPKLWREYSSELASSLKTDFKIDSRLVVEEKSYSRLGFFKIK